jgi:hypothetical protein
MRRFLTIFLMLALALVVLGQVGPVQAQAAQGDDLVVFTRYPAQVVERGKNISFSLTLQSLGEAQIVHLEMAELPDGWNATFRGGGNVVKAVYVEPDDDVHRPTPSHRAGAVGIPGRSQEAGLDHRPHRHRDPDRRG